MSDVSPEPLTDGQQIAQAGAPDNGLGGQLPGANEGRRGVPPNTEPPPGTNLNEGRRGVASPVEPPSNSLELEHDFENWDGRLVRLPDGSLVADPHSPTGSLMSPFGDLGDVATAARRVGPDAIDYLSTHLKEVLTDHGGVADHFVNIFRGYIGQGGTFDYQRRRYALGIDGFTQLRQFRNVSNFNVGCFVSKWGYPSG
jgi:hypothetical protein